MQEFDEGNKKTDSNERSKDNFFDHFGNVRYPNRAPKKSSKKINYTYCRSADLWTITEGVCRLCGEIIKEEDLIHGRKSFLERFRDWIF